MSLAVVRMGMAPMLLVGMCTVPMPTVHAVAVGLGLRLVDTGSQRLGQRCHHRLLLLLLLVSMLTLLALTMRVGEGVRRSLTAAASSPPAASVKDAGETAVAIVTIMVVVVVLLLLLLLLGVVVRCWHIFIIFVDEAGELVPSVHAIVALTPHHYILVAAGCPRVGLLLLLLLLLCLLLLLTAPSAGDYVAQ